MKEIKSTVKNIPHIGERVEFASRFIPKCTNLLDIGCGDGILKMFIFNKVKNIYGLDNDRLLITEAKKIYKEAALIDINIQDLPYKNDYFDCVTCLDVIEHILDPVKLINKIYKVLKLHGILIISTPNIRFSNHLIQLILKGNFPKTSIDTRIYDGGHIHFFTYKDLESLLLENKFKIVKTEGIINKNSRGWKGRLLQSLFGKKLMNEFRSPGILLIAQKV